MMARLAALIVTLVCATGCATMTKQIVDEAMKGLAFEGDYLPPAGGNPEALAALFDHLTKDLRISVAYLPADDAVLHGAFGVAYAIGDDWYIRARQDLSVNASIEVLAHEAGHLFQPPYLSTPQGDVFAEMVAAHVADRLGVPGTVSTSAIWLRQHKPSLRVALDLEQEIQYVVNIVLPRSRAHAPATRR